VDEEEVFDLDGLSEIHADRRPGAVVQVLVER